MKYPLAVLVLILAIGLPAFFLFALLGPTSLPSHVDISMKDLVGHHDARQEGPTMHAAEAYPKAH